MKLLGALVSLAVLATPAVASAAGSPGHSFRLADGSAACAAVAASKLVCRGEGARPGLEIDANATPRVSPRAIRWSSSTPVLKPGEVRRFGAVACTVARSTIVCTNAAGATIFVSATRIAVAL